MSSSIAYLFQANTRNAIILENHIYGRGVNELRQSPEDNEINLFPLLHAKEESTRATFAEPILSKDYVL
jgi:hypothetical protein